MNRGVLAVHTIIIGIIGLAFIFYPSLLAEGNPLTNIFIQSFGVSCLSFSALSSLMLTMDGHKYVQQIGSVTLTFLHFGLFIVHMLGWLENISPFAFAVLHLIFLVLFTRTTIKYYK